MEKPEHTRIHTRFLIQDEYLIWRVYSWKETASTATWENRINDKYNCYRRQWWFSVISFFLGTTSLVACALPIATLATAKTNDFSLAACIRARRSGIHTVISNGLPNVQVNGLFDLTHKRP